jgi:hypothetical protein
MTLPLSERRGETRQDTSEDIKILVRLPKLLEIHGRLVDLSSSGFRAVHMFPELSAGQKIEFKWEGNEGIALVVWNRIFEEHVETGFFILHE